MVSINNKTCFTLYYNQGLVIISGKNSLMSFTFPRFKPFSCYFWNKDTGTSGK